MSKPHSIKFVKEIAESKKCKLLSKTYKNLKEYLEFECFEGHIFKKSFDNMLHQNQGCPICVRGISEELCRYVFENVYNDKFNKTTFKYKNHTLELDGYNDENKIAFEYNGRQHYELTTMTKTQESLKYRKYLDNLKSQYCKEVGIDLIIIPYTISNDEISKFICNKLKYNKIIDVKDFIENYSYFKHRKGNIEEIINSKNGKLIEFNFNNIKLSCDKGHEWSTKYNIIKRGHWCRKCATKDNIRSFSSIISIFTKNQISCLSNESEYKNGDSILTFKCENGHIFKDTVNYLLDRINSTKKEGRKKCQFCLVEKQKNVLQKIENNGLTLVNNLQYKNRNTPVDWICINGHKQTEKLKNLVEKIRRGSHLCKCKSCLKQR